MSAHLFLFLDQSLELESACSAVFSTSTDPIEPWQTREIEALKQLNQQYPLTIVLPANMASAHLITLPTLKKAELMIPNILEEEIIEDIEDTHFVFDKKAQLDDKYVIFTINKSKITAIIEQAKAAGLPISCLTSELLFQQGKQLTIGDTHFQIVIEDAIGALAIDKLQHVDMTTIERINKCKDATAEIDELENQHLEQMDTPYRDYIVLQLMEQSSVNFLQGAFKVQNKKSVRKLRVAIFALVASVVFFIGVNIQQYYQADTHLEQLKKDNFQIYKKFFPDATSLISPKFRIEQLLKQNQRNAKTAFFAIMENIAPILNQQKNLVIQSIQFQNDQLTLAFQLPGFQEVEKLQNKLETKQLNINQISATTKDKQVNVTWRISQ
jgi:general secretion pathway protein L